jgi:hypothetical protein
MKSYSKVMVATLSSTSMGQGCLIKGSKFYHQGIQEECVMKAFKVFCVAGLLAVALPVLAEESGETEANDAHPVVEATLQGDQVVKVNTGSEVVDGAANLAIKCGERTAAFKACDAAGGFKAMACRKIAEIRYKNVECPNL